MPKLTIQFYPSKRLPEIFRQTIQNLIEQFQDAPMPETPNNSLVFVPMLDKKAVGYASVTIHQKSAHISSIFIHPVIKAIILHFMIGYEHPFADGNGRTARAIFYWYLLSRDYWLIEYMSISRIIINSRTQYAKAYL